ncbi:MAG: S-layer homology domain-containing protein [Vallitaleaceae bacterium]|nr:S-layer homology domain-containing protein [Vallitaleaceae bacterium]
MTKNLNHCFKVLLSTILLLTFMPLQANASIEDVPKVLSSSISEKTIAYKGVINPSYTTIKFKTNKPVQAFLEISGKNGSTRIKVSEWLNKQSEYEINFVPMDYHKAQYDQLVALPAGTYNVRVDVTEENYNSAIVGIGTIQIVKEDTEQPLIEVLDVQITNEVKDSGIAPKMKFIYKVNRPAYIEAPVFRDYLRDYVSGESSQIDFLSIEKFITVPGTYEVEWDLKPPIRFFKNIKGITTVQPNNKTIIPPKRYRIIFRSSEESIRKYASNIPYAVLHDDKIMDLWVTLNNGNTQLLLLERGQASPVEVKETPIIPVANVNFEDINGHWSKENIVFLCSKQLLKGVGDNKFDPNKKITRAEYMAMVLRAINEKVITQDTTVYTDIKPTDWYYDVVETASDLGLVAGYNDHTFQPNKSITRQEMTAIAEKAIFYKTKHRPIMDETLTVLDAYSDKNLISSWARNSVAIATSYTLVNGKANQQFDPNGISTRAEGAAIMTRLYRYIDASRYNII